MSGGDVGLLIASSLESRLRSLTRHPRPADPAMRPFPQPDPRASDVTVLASLWRPSATVKAPAYEAPNRIALVSFTPRSPSFANLLVRSLVAAQTSQPRQRNGFLGRRGALVST